MVNNMDSISFSIKEYCKIVQAAKKVKVK